MSISDNTEDRFHHRKSFHQCPSNINTGKHRERGEMFDTPTLFDLVNQQSDEQSYHGWFNCNHDENDNSDCDIDDESCESATLDEYE